MDGLDRIEVSANTGSFSFFTQNLVRIASRIFPSSFRLISKAFFPVNNIKGSSVYIAVYKNDGFFCMADDFLDTTGCIPHLAFEEDYCPVRFGGFNLFEYLCELLICLKLLEFNAVKALSAR